MDSLTTMRPAVSVKPRDTWWTCLVVDPVAVPIVARLLRWHWVTPNRLTATSAAFGLAAGICLAEQAWVVGALVYQLSFLLDCLDGKLAATRRTLSPWGGFVDTLGDSVRFAACATGLAVGLAPNGIAVGVVAAYPAFRCLALLLVKARPRANTPAAPPLLLPADPRAVLRAAPRRLALPGTTVDTETVAFTIGPIVGLSFAGLCVAAVVDLLHAGYIAGTGLRAALRPSD